MRVGVEVLDGVWVGVVVWVAEDVELVVVRVAVREGVGVFVGVGVLLRVVETTSEYDKSPFNSTISSR